MVKWLRLDERLIHGQIATKWSRTLGVNRIIVADDLSAGNPLTQKSLMMAAPADCKTVIVTVDKAIALCNDPRSEDLSILLLVSNPDSLLKVAKAIPGIPQINVGNYGRVAPKKPGQTRKMYDKNLYAYDDEVQTLRECIATGIPCNLQTIPDDSPKSLEKLLG